MDANVFKSMPPVVPGLALTKLLGFGGFATVWRGTRAADGLIVAVKVGAKLNKVHRARFVQEAQALDRVGPPTVPKIYDSGCLSDGRPYMVMEMVSSRLLSAMLEDSPQGRLDMQTAYGVAAGLLQALARVHAIGLSHRDLKPENIFVSPDSTITLIDFGLVKDDTPSNAELTQTGTVVGTLEYMAPESLRGERSGPKADLYAFGVIAYELLTGRPPFVGNSAVVERGHLAHRPPRPSTLAKVPLALESIVLDCLQKCPRRRPESAHSLLAKLREVDLSPREPKNMQRGKRKLMGGGPQPTVILYVSPGPKVRKVVSIIEAQQGQVVRHSGGHLISCFSSLDVVNPIRYALAAANKIAEAFNAPQVLHIARLRIVTRSGRRTYYGAPLYEPSSWIPSTSWNGTLVTEEARGVLPKDSLLTKTHDSFFRAPAKWEDENSNVPFVGQHQPLIAFQKAWQTCLESQTPGLLTVTAGPGLGKTRLARKLADLVRDNSGSGLGRSLSIKIPPAVFAQHSVVVLRIASLLNSSHKDCEDDFDEMSLSAMGGTTLVKTGRLVELSELIQNAARDRPLCMIVDDAHFASDDLLDALEHTVRAAKDTPLLLVAIAAPTLDDLRIRWGREAHRHERVSLDPLDEGAAFDLAGYLLQPAEYVPNELIRELVRRSGFHPAYLTQMVRTLKDEGLIRKRVHGVGYYVATTRFDELPSSVAEQWLVTRELEYLLPELSACVRLCSTLGVEFSVNEFEYVQTALETERRACTIVDAHVGLRELVGFAVLQTTPKGYTFKNRSFQIGVYDLVSQSDKSHAHRFAADYWRIQVQEDNTSIDNLQKLAQHSSASGENAEARQIYFGLGEQMRKAHQYAQADRHYSAMLDLEPEDPMEEALGRLGRAKCRYPCDRISEAIQDLEVCRRIAEDLCDKHLQAEALLEQSIALDWNQQYQDSFLMIDEAHEIIDLLNAPHLQAKAWAARGRRAAREEEVEATIEFNQRAVKQASALCDEDTVAEASLLLGWGLARAGRLNEAEQTFQQVIDGCQRRGDKVHLAAAYCNRLIVWEQRGEPEKGVNDLRRAIQLGRELGQPKMERVPTYNLAELYYFTGNYTEACRLAKRGRELQERLDLPVSYEPLLLLRVYLAQGCFEEAQELFNFVYENCRPDMPMQEELFRAVALVLRDTSTPDLNMDLVDDSWEMIFEDCRSFPPQVSLEVLWWWALVAQKTERTTVFSEVLIRAAPALPSSPTWQARFRVLQEDTNAFWQPPRLRQST